jgi:hypothetical protein
LELEVSTMEETLDPLDRATMVTWRASNVLAWASVALAVALVLHTVGDELAKRVHRFNVWSLNGRPLPEFGTWQFFAPSYGYKAFVAIVIGAAIGLVVGSKALKAPAWIAAGVASAYAVISWFVLETSFRVIHATGEGSNSGLSAGFAHHGLPQSAREWSYSLVALFAVAVAPLVARLVAKRRAAESVSPGTLG